MPIEGETRTNTRTGQVAVFRGGQWYAQAAPSDAGAFGSLDKVGKRQVYNAANKTLMDDMEAYKRAGPLRDQLERFLELNRDTDTGGIIDSIPGFGGWAANAGWNPKRSELGAISGAMQANDVPKGQGQVSNFERNLFALGTPGIDKKGPVNFNIAQRKLALFDQEGARLKFMQEWLAQNGNVTGAAEAWDKRLAGSPYAVTTPDGSTVYAKSQAAKLRDRKKRIDAATGKADGFKILKVE